MPGITLDELKTARSKLLKKGFLPIPAHIEDKHPLIDWKDYKNGDWNKGIKKVTGVRANVGILTGAKSSVIVLDVDNKPPAKFSKDPDSYRETKGTEDWQLLVDQHGEPNTLKCISPSNGSHYYFLYDQDFADQVKTTNSCVIAIDGKLCAIDLRGDGGFIMTPPSVTSVGQYVWQPNDKINDVPISPMPEWLKNLIIESCKSTTKTKHDVNCNRNFVEPFSNDPLDWKSDWELFQKSKYFHPLVHQVYKVDKYQRLVLKEITDFDCQVCNRRHVSHSNHPFLVRRNGSLLFVCRSSTGEKKFVVEIKEEIQSGEKSDAESDLTPHQMVMSELWAYSRKHKLMKLDGWIYKPRDADHPAAYLRWMEYEPFINMVLRGNSIFTATPKRFKDIMEHLAHYDDADLPLLKVDLNILACSNGCLLLKEVEFVPYNDKRVKGKVARHYIDQTFTGKTHTPVFDSFVLYQLEEEVSKEESLKIYDILLAFIGRLFFKVRQWDRWGVAPLILGESNTGKSTLYNIIKKMHAPNSFGVVTANHQKTFGLDELYEKSVIAIPDMPHNMRETLDATILQTMITGEDNGYWLSGYIFHIVYIHT
jgi:hypothetical protein